MNPQTGSAITFSVHFKTNGVSVPTPAADVLWDVWNPAGVQIITNGSGTAPGSGFQEYELDAAYVLTEGAYKALAKCADTTLNQMHLPDRVDVGDEPATGAALVLAGWFASNGVTPALLGATPTVDIRNPAGTLIVSDGALTSVGGVFREYSLAAGSVDVGGVYQALFKCADTALDAQQLSVQVLVLETGVRSGMSALLTRLRRMTGLTGANAAVFTDRELQDILDTHRTDQNGVLLESIQSYPNGVSAYLDFQASEGDWEADAVLQNTSYATVSPATSDYLRGRWTFAAEPSWPLYATGRTYDLNAAAGDVCEAWAALVALDFDFSSNEQSFKRSQQHAALLKQAERFRSGGRATSACMVRSDVGGYGVDAYERMLRR